MCKSKGWRIVYFHSCQETIRDKPKESERWKETKFESDGFQLSPSEEREEGGGEEDGDIVKNK